MAKTTADEPKRENSLNAALKTYRQELVVYVVWHPEYSAGREMATLVFDQLTRDSKVERKQRPTLVSKRFLNVQHP